MDGYCMLMRVRMENNLYHNHTLVIVIMIILETHRRITMQNHQFQKLTGDLLDNSE